ncbi:MAG: Sodium/glucose cotransporter [bacterium]|nr:Sodium/glucose cotransporter [bacterium]
MVLTPIDWASIVVFFVVSLLVGLSVARKSGIDSVEYFAAGRKMPWWLLGTSMVATTFSTDTPNLVTSIVRNEGVAGNWAWWAFLLTGMLTVFVYAALWQRSGVLTDIEFYELRYSGKAAAFLRGFRAIYLGVIFNVLIMASVTLAAIKIGAVMLNLTPIQTILIAGVVTAVYSSLGGLRGVLITDFFQFILAMIGSVGAAYVALNHPSVGGLSGLLSHESVRDRLNLFPDFSNTDQALAVFIIPIAVQWWSVWYPGSEPGGGAFIAQRMLAAKDHRNAIGATFLFNAAHYALRPWPWILVALCSIVVFPDLDSLRAAFPNAANVVDHDMGYSAMLTFLPPGLMGLVVASLIAAYMSTISTLLNLGSSYVTHDFYQRFIHPESTEKHLVQVGRITTVLLMAASGFIALFLVDAYKTFQIILQVGAGTGLLFILRWFWWRINAVSEIAAMLISFAIAYYFAQINPESGLRPWEQLLVGVAVSTVGWVLVAFISPATDEAKLISFYRKVTPGGPGWRRIRAKVELEGPAGDDPATAWKVPQGILCMVLGCAGVYSALFATGYWIYGMVPLATGMTLIAVASSFALFKAWNALLE